MGPLCMLSRLYRRVAAGPLWVRNIYSKSGKWEPKYSKIVREELESYWKDRLPIQHGVAANTDTDKRLSYYVLSMFPYPSGKLHMGHVRVYVISDTMARYQRLLGRNVVHPMGWDAFGLPAENAAIERGEKPKQWTYKNIQTMKEQMEGLCLSFNWDQELSTCDPGYYRWTQFLFLKMFEAGLVYQKEGPVNWDPVDRTVLADEQIDEHGRSWRSGAVAERKFLNQWYIRTTAYSKSLMDGLNEVNAELWRDVISLQRHWIGECNGVRIELPVQTTEGGNQIKNLSLFMLHPYAIYGISHILVSSLNYLWATEQQLKSSNVTENSKGVTRLSMDAYNPITGKSIPIFVDNLKDFGPNLDAHVGIPSCNEDDRRFAGEYQLPFVEVIDKTTGGLINSEKLNGMMQQEATTAVIDMAKSLRCGGYVTSEKGRDWLISRQRYWGTPIPIIHCPKHGAVAVPYKDLPVILPELDEFKGQGHSPLSSAVDWLHTKCPVCGEDSLRETDTMDTFVDSSWYYLRYLDVNNHSQPFSKNSASRYMPVDLYIGGKEHATMHLYYARFFSHFLHDIGMLDVREPFVNLLTQGMVMGRSYRLKNSNKYIPPSDVDLSGSKPVQCGTNEPVISDWEKMSKSKYNGVDPQEILNEYGTDSTRLCILINVAPKSDRPWSNDVFVGVTRWQNKVWSLVTDFINQRVSHAAYSTSISSETSHSSVEPCSASPRAISSEEFEAIEREICYQRNFALLEVTFHMGTSFLLNTALSRLQSLTNILKKVPASVAMNSFQYERALVDLSIMLSPFAPMFTSELWAGLTSVSHLTSHYDWNKSILEQSWPDVDNDHHIRMSVKVNGKLRYDVPLPMVYSETRELTKAVALKLAEEQKELYEQNISRQSIDAINFTIHGSLKVELDYIIREEKLKKKKKQES